MRRKWMRPVLAVVIVCAALTTSARADSSTPLIDGWAVPTGGTTTVGNYSYTEFKATDRDTVSTSGGDMFICDSFSPVQGIGWSIALGGTSAVVDPAYPKTFADGSCTGIWIRIGFTANSANIYLPAVQWWDSGADPYNDPAYLTTYALTVN